MRRNIGPLFLVTLLMACGESPREPEPPSDPTDYFYRNEDVARFQTTPAVRWHERKPGRTFETTLRPTQMRGALPTAYLSRVTRNYRPWAKRIYDVANLGFDFSELDPLPPERTIGWGIKGTQRDNEILLEIGGYNSSFAMTPEAAADAFKGRITQRGGGVAVLAKVGGDRYFFDRPDAGNLDGQPMWVECYSDWMCKAELTIPQEMAGFRPLHEGGAPPTRGTTGAMLRITFHPDRLDEWPEVRRKAACFTAIAIPDLDIEAIAPQARLRCGDVRTAIDNTMAD